MAKRIIELEQGWDIVQKGITKVKNALDKGFPECSFDPKEYLSSYTIIHIMCMLMCMQEPPHDYSQQLYDRYKETFDEYITYTV